MIIINKHLFIIIVFAIFGCASNVDNYVPYLESEFIVNHPNWNGHEFKLNKFRSNQTYDKDLSVYLREKKIKSVQDSLYLKLRNHALFN